PVVRDLPRLCRRAVARSPARAIGRRAEDARRSGRRTASGQPLVVPDRNARRSGRTRRPDTRSAVLNDSTEFILDNTNRRAAGTNPGDSTMTTRRTFARALMAAGLAGALAAPAAAQETVT